MAFIKESVSFFSYQEWIYFKNVTALNQISQVFELIYPSQDSVMLRKTLDPKNKKEINLLIYLFFRSSSWTWTKDPLINSQML